MHTSTPFPEGVLYTVGMSGWSTVYVPTTPIFPICSFWAPVQTCMDPLFCLPGPSWLALHLARPSAHLCTPLCTSVHLHASLCTSVHPCTTFALHFPGLVTLIGPSILTLDPFGYPGQLSPSATGHNAHPQTSVESSPNSAAPIWPIHFLCGPAQPT